jgi:hypothetical protein
VEVRGGNKVKKGLEGSEMNRENETYMDGKGIMGVREREKG